MICVEVDSYAVIGEFTADKLFVLILLWLKNKPIADLSLIS
jgi:hypothetical protein